MDRRERRGEESLAENFGERNAHSQKCFNVRGGFKRKYFVDLHA